MSTRLCIAALAVVMATAANAQEEQTDPYAELGLLDESSPVADESSATAEESSATAEEEEAAPREITKQDILLEHARFVSYIDEQNYDQADISAKRVIEMAIRLHGPQSHETAKALSNLGVVQNSTEQYNAAIQNFTSSIEILEILEDRLNSQLVNPLKGLGAAQMGIGRPDLARQTYDRATHITHVNEGPHNAEQVEILESLAEASVRMGDVDSAKGVLDRIHILNVRHFSDDVLGLLPSLMRRASWQHRAGYYNDERATYRRAIRIIEDSAGKNDPLLVDPLIRLAESFYYFEPLGPDSQRYAGSSTGEVYLRRANRIAEGAKDLPWLELITTRLALADYYMFSSEFGRAKNLYEEIWDDLSSEEDRHDMREELLGDPRPIFEQALPLATSAAAGVSRRDGEIQTGVVNVYYVVTTRGRARVEKTTTEPAEFTDMQRMVEREVRRRVYRPTINEGKTAVSGPLVFRHEFKYSKSELEDIRARDESQAAASEQ